MDMSIPRLLMEGEERYASSNAYGPLDRAFAAFHLSQWLIESGLLRRADEIGLATWRHALESLRLSDGMPVQEVVQLVDGAAFVLVELRALTEGATGVRRTLDDLVALHERFRERLAVFNRHSVIALDGPKGPVDPEKLLRGRASAMHALLTGHPADALRIVESALRDWKPQGRGDPYYLKTRALSARCLHELGERKAARSLLEQLRDESHPLQMLLCDVGDLYAQTYVGTGEEQQALNELDKLLDAASQAGMALRWTNLMCTRAELLEASGSTGDARACLRVALLGPHEDSYTRRWPEASSFPLPSVEGYRLAFMRARRILSASSDTILKLVDEVLESTIPPPVPKRSKYRGRSMPPRAEGDARRIQLHEQAVLALREFQEQGKPFALYLRKFDVNVLHRAALLGPGLLEVGLYDILPTSWNMLTIQDASEIGGYTGSGSAFDRTVPALNLEDDKWEEVARYLIANARAIVSECLMLSEGVRAELEIIDQLGRNEHTLLVLPGPGSYMQRIDDHPLIRRFSNVVWGEVLSDVELATIPFVAQLLADSQSEAPQTAQVTTDSTEEERWPHS